MNRERFDRIREDSRENGWIIWEKRRPVVLSVFGIDYSMDLYLYDTELFKVLALKHFGNADFAVFLWKRPSQIERFLREYREIDLTLLYVAKIEDIRYEHNWEFGWTYHDLASA